MANMKRANTSGVTKSGTAIADVPDAPTIGTVTDTGAGGTVTVAFTAAVTGGTPTSYTATSTPSSITGTGASSPITVSGLTNNTSYTFKVKGVNSTATGPESSASGSVTPTLATIGSSNYIATLTDSVNVGSGTAIVTGDSEALVWAENNGKGVLYSYKPDMTIYWARQYSAGGTALYEQGIGRDSSGNIYLAGWDGTNGVLLKTDSTGSTISWGKRVASTPMILMGTDSSGNTYSWANATEGETIVKYNSAGSVQWQKTSSNGLQTRGGYVNNAGTYFYTHGYTRPDGSNHCWLRRFDASTGSITHKVYISNYSLGSGSFWEDSTGALYLGCGESAGGTKPFLIKTDATFSGITWQVNVTAGSTGGFRGGTTDSSNNVYAVLDYGYVVKLNSSGTVQWQRQITSSGYTTYLNAPIVYGGNLIIPVSFSTTVGYAADIIIPLDGSKTGTYTVGGKTISYAASSLTFGTPTNTLNGDSTSNSNSSLSFTNPSMSYTNVTSMTRTASTI